MGFDQKGLYERVIVNRQDASIAVDRMDANWWIAEPFLAQRDLFYVDPKEMAEMKAGTAKNIRLNFVRHNFWLHKVYKFNTVFWSNFSAMSYKKAISS